MIMGNGHYSLPQGPFTSLYGIGRSDVNEELICKAVLDERNRCMDVVLAALHQAVVLATEPGLPACLKPLTECLKTLRDGHRPIYDPRQTHFPLEYTIETLVKARTHELQTKVDRLREAARGEGE